MKNFDEKSVSFLYEKTEQLNEMYEMNLFNSNLITYIFCN